MYGMTMHVAQSIDTYLALHRAVIDLVGDDVDGLILHCAHPTAQGFQVTEVWQSKDQLDAFNRDVFARAMQSSGVDMGGPPEVSEFDPVVVMTPRSFNSDRS